MSTLRSLLSLLLLFHTVASLQETGLLNSTERPADTCATVERAYPNIEVAYYSNPNYRKTQSEYWNKQCQYLSPSCIIYPTSTSDVAKVVDVIGANGEGFAIKSGGHMPNCGFASVEKGPLIAFSKMKGLKYDTSKQSVRIEPGLRWQDVADELQKYKRSAVGGRIGHVGVPGYLLGGGLSFHSTQYGWASTNVLEYEVVLANGTVRSVTKESHPDLHRALQSSGNTLGIVTAFTLRTFPQGSVWGGWRMYSADKTPSVLRAIRDFTEHYPDPKAAIIATCQQGFYGALGLWTVFFFYDGAVPPPNTFENFNRLTATVDTTRTKSLVEMLYDNNLIASPNGTYVTMATETMPLPRGDKGMEAMETVHSQWSNSASQYIKDAGMTGLVTIAYQPIPQMIHEATEKHGGNVMDMGPGDRIILEYDVFHGFEEGISLADKATNEIHQGSRKIIDRFRQNKVLEDISIPLFMNDAYRRQDFWARFKERDFMRSVKADVDPTNFWSQRTNGWKL